MKCRANTHTDKTGLYSKQADETDASTSITGGGLPGNTHWLLIQAQKYLRDRDEVYAQEHASDPIETEKN